MKTITPKKIRISITLTPQDWLHFMADLVACGVKEGVTGTSVYNQVRTALAGSVLMQSICKKQIGEN